MASRSSRAGSASQCCGPVQRTTIAVTRPYWPAESHVSASTGATHGAITGIAPSA